MFSLIALTSTQSSVTGKGHIMTANTQENQVQPPESKPSDKELNFRNLEARYQRELEKERSARIEAERLVQESRKNSVDDDDDESEPYVDHKKLAKKLNKFGEQTRQIAQSEVQKEVQKAIQQERQSNWLKQNSDFQEVMQYAEVLAQRNPDLAESILEMPEGFERQKLVYKNIKAMGIHKPEVKAPSIQEKVDANRRGPFYQPSSAGTSPYSSGGDFSQSGQKAAFDKMQELKNRLRLG